MSQFLTGAYTKPELDHDAQEYRVHAEFGEVVFASPNEQECLNWLKETVQAIQLHFTEHTIVCQCCSRTVRIAQEVIDKIRRDEGPYPNLSDRDIALSLEYCIRCVDGAKTDEEVVNPNAGECLANAYTEGAA